MKNRAQQVNQLIRKELSQIIFREMEFPFDVLVTITRVGTSSNLIEAKVYVSCLPEDKKARTLEILNKMIYHLQQLLNKRLKMRPIPRIRFVEEKETAAAGKVEEILEEIKRKD